MKRNQTGIIHLGLILAVLVIAAIAGVAYYVGHHNGGISASSAPMTTAPNFSGSVAPTNINQQSPAATQQPGSSTSTTNSSTKSTSGGSSSSSSAGNTTGSDSTTPPDPASCPYREVCPAQ